MKLDTRQQVLLALYIEYHKDLPKMESVSCTALNMDIEVFNHALRYLSDRGYIANLVMFAADNDKFYTVDISNVSLTREGMEYIEKNFSIEKEINTTDKIKYIIRKCGVLGLQALKLFGVEALTHIHDIY